MSPEQHRRARRAVKATLVAAWLFGAAAAWFTREHEIAFALFTGLTGVVFVFAALAIAHVADDEIEVTTSSDDETTDRITVRHRTVKVVDEVRTTTEDDEIHP